MEDAKKRYLWKTQCDIAAARKEADMARDAVQVKQAELELARGAANDAISKVAQLEAQSCAESLRFQTEVMNQFRIPAQMPPQDSEFSYIWKSKLVSTLVKNPAAGYVTTFIADAAGPELVTIDGTVIRNIDVGSELPVTDSVPLYPAGATLRYYCWKNGLAPTAGQPTIEIDHNSFHRDTNFELSVVKTPGSAPININNCYKEGSLEYLIAKGNEGLPVAIKRITSVLNHTDVRLNKITGRIIQIEPICRADDDDKSLLALSAMLISNRETKSAARRQ